MSQQPVSKSIVMTSVVVQCVFNVNYTNHILSGEFCVFYCVVPGEFNRFQGQCRANSARFIFYFTRYRANSGAQLSILNRPYHHDGGQARKRPHQARRSSGPNQARRSNRPNQSQRWSSRVKLNDSTEPSTTLIKPETQDEPK